tara:strand:- start:590 stop:1042 length:453 start_codon:yes stop_codon:yes gene_type:complete
MSIFRFHRKDFQVKKIIGLALILLFNGCAKNTSLKSQMLLNAQRLNVLEQPIIYPTQQPAEVTSVISVLQPGQETGWHKHMVPLHSYVMEGTCTLEFETDGEVQTRTFSKGDTWVGAADIWHNASNRTDQPAVVFVVFMGAEGLENIVFR